MHWDDLRYLVALRRHRTMSATARALGTNVATVSRRLDRFTCDTGRPGFVKSSDGWVALPHMGRLLDLCESFEQQMQQALSCPDLAPDTLTVGAPPFVIGTYLIPALPRLTEQNPAIRVNFQDRINEDGLGRCDLVLRGERPDQGRIVAPRIGSLSFGIYRHRTWQDGPWVGLTEDFDATPVMRTARSRFKRPPDYRVAQFHHAADLMVRLNAAGPLPARMAATCPDLCAFDDGDARIIGNVWACYHLTRKGDPALRNVLDWVRTALGAAQAEPA